MFRDRDTADIDNRAGQVNLSVRIKFNQKRTAVHVHCDPVIHQSEPV